MEKDVTMYLRVYANIFLKFNTDAVISVRHANAKILKNLVRLSNEKKCVRATRCPKSSSTIVQKLVEYVGEELMTQNRQQKWLPHLPHLPNSNHQIGYKKTPEKCQWKFGEMTRENKWCNLNNVNTQKDIFVMVDCILLPVP